jgi:glyoxylase-like metal-dependent hydrolase (beta-lactamase superfamily II)
MTTIEAMSVGADDLRRLLDEGRPVTVLDVRKTEDRAEWAIPGSLHVDAYEALKSGDPDALAAVALPLDTPVVTVCGAGKVSLVAMEQLRARGVEAWSLRGGMKAWSLAWNAAKVSVPGSTATIVQVRRTGKGCLSYLIGNDDEAAVVDAALPPEVYQRLATERGWTITRVLDTHVHADHLSRTRLVAEAAGATLSLPAQDRVAYPFEPVSDGGAFEVGSTKVVALRTPGHTPESTSYLVDGASLVTGDTLFLAAVGRPDLEASPDETAARARLLYRSLRALAALPGETLVLPGHTSEPVAFDGRPIAAPLAEVRQRIDALRLPEDAFVAHILSRIPPTPPNHAAIVAFNEAGELPPGDPTDLEAGANRCAVA